MLVIIDSDLRMRVARLSKQVKINQSLNGIKTLSKKDSEKAPAAADQIIRNTYRTLMTRGQKFVLTLS
ncbi:MULTISPECIES: DNA/RNA helicase domain-containing protein [Cytobacillus]|uniref:DNA/RNA helicase domain-containing protein n=1 Tax=Cytobacillus TaxID=2675230 RepID=UPI0001F451C2|nr:DNA/RNA helicase domain-containing protein [Cytobacillus oceanisediminis]EFV77925.1 hypothetical protein HMPREF1013_01795 [Bacillus sp. 2_A_57_CT2]MBU8730755.1 DUF2075 domain-containing protein [Cytobacillus oceanisediminis]MBY0157722.1 DUF2075 domain-containing protein [Cytobacillus firmus]MDK7666423.1 DUF2075 domain-containing protein [Cytobacillus oceanisediminis]